MLLLFCLAHVQSGLYAWKTPPADRQTCVLLGETKVNPKSLLEDSNCSAVPWHKHWLGRGNVELDISHWLSLWQQTEPVLLQNANSTAVRENEIGGCQVLELLLTPSCWWEAASQALYTGASRTNRRLLWLTGSKKALFSQEDESTEWHRFPAISSCCISEEIMPLEVPGESDKTAV